MTPSSIRSFARIARTCSRLRPTKGSRMLLAWPKCGWKRGIIVLRPHPARTTWVAGERRRPHEEEACRARPQARHHPEALQAGPEAPLREVYQLPGGL